MRRQRRTYTEEFKRDAVEMSKDKGITKVSSDLDVDQTTIRRWVKELDGPDEDPQESLSKLSNAELLKKVRSLEKENGYLKKINDVLKKSTAIFSKDHLPPSK